MTTEFKVADATCGHCKATIEEAVTSIDGVTAAQMDIGSKVLSVNHESSVASDTVAAAISSAGYTPEPVA